MINKTFVYYSTIDCYQNEDIFNSHLSLLDDERKAYILSFKQKEDQKRSLGVSILLLKAIKELKEEKYPIFTDKNGKMSTNHYQFNFSHSGNVVMVAISNLSVGCDVEKKDKVSLSIAKRFFGENEYNNVIKDENYFIRYWTLKESYLKAIGVGLRVSLSSFEIDLENMKIKNPLTREFYYLKEYSVGDYHFAVSSQNNNISHLKYIDIVG